MGQQLCMSDTRNVTQVNKSIEENNLIAITKNKFIDAGQGHIFDAWDTLEPSQ